MPMQTGIFNVLDHGLTTADAGDNNRIALQALVNNLLTVDPMYTNGRGGTVLFPAWGTFNIKGQILINHGAVSGAAIIFVGSGQQALSSPNILKRDVGDLFVVQNNDASMTPVNIGGVVFQDLMISYDANLTSGAAIRLDNAPGTNNAAAQNVRIFRVVFLDCPTAVNFHSSLQCSMLESTVWASDGNANVQSGIVLGGFPTSAIETYIAGCRFYTNGVANPSQKAIIVNGTEHLRVMNTRIEGFQIGIAMQPQGASYRNHFENVTVREFSSTNTSPTPALLIQPTASTGIVSETAFVGCEFGPGDKSGTAYTSGGVYIDPNTGTIDAIHFVSCTSVNWPGPGLETHGGTNIEILGGYYCCNGQGTAPGVVKAGIYIYGTASVNASYIRIVGVACTNKFYSAYSEGYLNAAQVYGILIATGAAPQNIIVHGCDLSGNNSQAVSAPTSLTNVRISDCAGYNDQATSIRSTPPSSGVVFSPAGYGYYGKAAFYVSGGTSVTVNINTINTGLSSGAFTLDPGEQAIVFYGGALNFYMVGK